MKRLLFILLTASLCGTSMAGRVELLDEPETTFEASQRAELPKALKNAFVIKGWKVSDYTQNGMTAHLKLRAHTVTVKVEIKETSYIIKYVDSTVLKYKEKKGKRYIHRSYNRWVQNVIRQADIILNLEA